MTDYLNGQRLTIARRHDARRMAYVNGGLWSLGNGLASTLLIIHLAIDLSSDQLGIGVGMILAAPHWCGVLRMLAPVLIGKMADRKRFCVGAFLLSAMTLLLLLIATAPSVAPSAQFALWSMVVLWCLYHLFQYLGTVALWSWFADLVPRPVRGRFIGRRQRWLVLGQAIALMAAGGFHWKWTKTFPDLPDWSGYAATALIGIGFFFLAILPLVKIPRTQNARSLRQDAQVSALLGPFRDRLFLRLVGFGCWFSFFNGISQSAHYLYPSTVLGIGLFGMLALKTTTRLGQVVVSPWAGRLVDRFGNRNVMLLSLALVSQGPLFYYLATVGPWWWIVGAWVFWIAYAGMNIGLPGLMLNLSPEKANSAYIATYFTVTGLCYAISTTLGGVLYDRFGAGGFSCGAWGTVGYYPAIFLFSWVARMSGMAVLLGLVKEPKRK